MNLHDLQTPAILVLEEAMMDNLKRYQRACDQAGKELWPMIKTHKSTAIANLQRDLGAKGFLCGTLDECEALAENGLFPLMYAYPLADPVNCRRAVELAKKGAFYVRVDDLDGAAILNAAARAEDVVISVTLIVDCGLHRFGRLPEEVLDFAKGLAELKNLRLVGLSTHPGHVYGESDPAKVPEYARQESEAMAAAAEALRNAGYELTHITAGSTPTFQGEVDDPNIGVCHPGNYIFQDCIQMANGTAREEQCALRVYATVISHPKEGLFLCDAGAKCLGLDLGAHGNTSVIGHGRVVGHPELVVAGLSEEVGKLKATGPTDLKVGDRIQIIPNHSCSAANLTDWYVVVGADGEITGHIPVDIRSNRSKKC